MAALPFAAAQERLCIYGLRNRAGELSQARKVVRGDLQVVQNQRSISWLVMSALAKIIAREADIAHANVPHERSAPISLNPLQSADQSAALTH